MASVAFFMNPSTAKQHIPAECDTCHRKISSERISLSFLLKDAMSNLFNLERGLFFTLWQLLKDPRSVVYGFISDDRYRYMNPFRLLLAVATIAVILQGFTDASYFTLPFRVSGTDETSTQSIATLLKSYLNIAILLSIPIIAIGTWVVFRKQKLNLAEHLVLNSYTYSLITALGAIVSAILLPFPESVAIHIREGGFLITMMPSIYIYTRVFHLKWWKGIGYFFMAFTLAVILVSVLVGIIIIIVKTLSPEMNIYLN